MSERVRWDGIGARKGKELVGDVYEQWVGIIDR
jgi:hypothetical protein